MGSHPRGHWPGAGVALQPLPSGQAFSSSVLSSRKAGALSLQRLLCRAGSEMPGDTPTTPSKAQASPASYLHPVSPGGVRTEVGRPCAHRRWPSLPWGWWAEGAPRWRCCWARLGWPRSRAPGLGPGGLLVQREGSS